MYSSHKTDLSFVLVSLSTTTKGVVSVSLPGLAVEGSQARAKEASAGASQSRKTIANPYVSFMLTTCGTDTCLLFLSAGLAVI